MPLPLEEIKKLIKINIPIICEKPLINSKNQMNEVKSLFSNKNLFLRDDKLIVDFVQNYRNFCELNFNKWFSDQIALSKT